jgi:hypothetical protein
MKNNMKRPDTPLAATPEPQPVNMGQVQQAQPMPPQNKFQATADSAIQQVNIIGKMNTPPPIQQKQPEPQGPPQK